MVRGQLPLEERRSEARPAWLATLVFCLACSACSEQKHGPQAQYLGTGGTCHVHLGADCGVGAAGSAIAGEGGAGGPLDGEGGAGGDLEGVAGAPEFDTGEEGVCATDAGVPSEGVGDGPVGRLDACLGPCPKGQCDSHAAPFEPGCASAYPCWVDENFPFCASGASTSYCLMVGVTPTQEYWLISCASGAATFERCPSSCSAANGQTYGCL